MSNVKNATWYTGVHGCIGVIEIDTIEEATGRRKNYIGVGEGFSEDYDIARIASSGVPFYTPPWLVYDIAEEAKRQAISAFYQEVCRRAERKMAETGRLEGVHYASMVEIMNEMGLIKI